MLSAYGITIAAALVGLAVWGLVLFVKGRSPDRTYLTVLALAELELLVLAAVVGVGIMIGNITGNLPLAGYLFLSLILLPLVSRPGAGDTRTRWDSATIAAVCIAVAVVVLRIISLL